MSAVETSSLVRVCAVDDIEVEGGVAALVAGEAVAIFRTYDGNIHAISNVDPFTGASVLSRGIVGTRTVEGVEEPFVASPLHKQPISLRTGRCLDDPATGVAVHRVRVADGQVHVGPAT